MQIHLYLDKTKNVATNISDYVTPGFTIQSRCDSAFATGTMTAYLTGEAFKYNVPPYTLITIDNTKYMCSSECSKYLNEENTYVHNFQIMELSSLLSCFLVNTKVFSGTGKYTTDADKARVLLSLMSEKYGYTITGTDSFETYLTGNYFYSFKAGTTLYDALNTMTEKYNCKVNVSGYLHYLNRITISIVPLDADEEYSYEDTQILSVNYSQNSDEYGKYIETEASNVVDRTTLTKFEYITARSNGTRLCPDYATVALPVKVEKITAFGLNDVPVFPEDIRIILDNTKVPVSDYEKLRERIGSATWGYSFRSWAGILYNDYGYSLTSFFSGFFSKYFTELNKFQNICFRLDSDGTTLSLNSNMDGHRYYWNGTEEVEDEYAYTHRYPLPNLIEKAEWDLLDEETACNKPFYAIGGDTIENMDSYYKNDLWDNVLHISKNSYISDINNLIIDETYSNDYGTVYMKINPYIGNNNTSMNLMFYVDAYCYTDPMLRDTKTESPLNESSFATFSRSYDNGAGTIDFDKMADGMRVTNNTLGRCELSLELNVTDAEELPEARQKLAYDSITWYISSVSVSYGYEKTTAIINLVRNYNKKADCIGIDTQFESTKNPLKNIVTRPILINGTCTNSNLPIWAKLDFTDYDNNVVSYMFQCTVQKASSKEIYFISLPDEYSAGQRKYDDSDYGDTAQLMVDCPYVDSNNENFKVGITLYSKTAGIDYGITKAESYMLPVISTRKVSGVEKSVLDLLFTKISDTYTVKTYKDAREALTITFEKEI